ncbi:hypothetical protein DL89DRAFT_297643 [Linderina pennispora]|uniref:Uncharacterized protein n=1 Tax=Linderina pennispora TaxID=61395 RepID=A0A1Y1VSF4_9FUNG|nr:uncharacterized protein DL89DRAFT_297643 [Linderina pennispora]ORX64218.1 hypothetical protein DL89DRAFT_297643 [Linderina pennispora]
MVKVYFVSAVLAVVALNASANAAPLGGTDTDVSAAIFSRPPVAHPWGFNADVFGHLPNGVKHVLLARSGIIRRDDDGNITGNDDDHANGSDDYDAKPALSTQPEPVLVAPAAIHRCPHPKGNTKDNSGHSNVTDDEDGNIEHQGDVRDIYVSGGHVSDGNNAGNDTDSGN